MYIFLTNINSKTNLFPNQIILKTCCFKINPFKVSRSHSCHKICISSKFKIFDLKQFELAIWLVIKENRKS